VAIFLGSRRYGGIPGQQLKRNFSTRRHLRDFAMAIKNEFCAASLGDLRIANGEWRLVNFEGGGWAASLNIHMSQALRSKAG